MRDRAAARAPAAHRRSGVRAAAAALAEKHYAQAVDLYTEAIRLNPNSAVYYRCEAAELPGVPASLHRAW